MKFRFTTGNFIFSNIDKLHTLSFLKIDEVLAHHMVPQFSNSKSNYTKTTTINEKRNQSERLTILNFELEICKTMFFEISLWMIQNFYEARRIFVRVHPRAIERGLHWIFYKTEMKIWAVGCGLGWTVLKKGLGRL